MELNRSSDLHYNKYFQQILPISTHVLYSRDLEFSDKIIVPRSVCKDLLRNKLPFPPQFILIPDRSMNSSIHCTVLEYTAEEGVIYLPFWMLGELGFKVFNKKKGAKSQMKSGYGVTLSILSLVSQNNLLSYAITRCSYLEFFCTQEVSTENIKSEISRYMFVRENSEVSVCISNVIVTIKVVKIVPNVIAVIQGDFQCVRLSELPAKPVVFKEEGTSTEVIEVKEKRFPDYQEKLPRFLIEIIKRKQNIDLNALNAKPIKPSGTCGKVSHRKNYSYAPIESPIIFRSRISTPELESYIKDHLKHTEVGKSLEDSTGALPPVYYSPIKPRVKSPQVLTITIPELSHQSPLISKKGKTKIPNCFKSRKERSITPLKMKKVKIDGLSCFNNGKITQANGKVLRGFKIL